jgi:glyoxylase-like metal-dependent hydrolase (beta-lactamase superfamily II)
VEPTSSAQFEASSAARIPPLEQVREDVWALPMPMPGGHLPYSFLYLLGDADAGVHVIDPGWDSDDNWALFTSTLRRLGVETGDVASIVATHLHPDHLGMAERMRRETGAALLLHSAEQVALEAGPSRHLAGLSPAEQLDRWGVPLERRAELAQIVAPSSPAVSADSTLADGDLLPISGFELTVVWTPGHTGGSICLLDEARSILFTGDHLLPTIFPGLGLGGATPTNPLADYLDGLNRVSGYQAFEALPGHEYRFTGIADRARQSAEHQLRRTREVAALVADNPAASVWQIATRLTWTAGWENLTDFFLLSALSQTAMHRDYVRQGRLE